MSINLLTNSFSANERVDFVEEEVATEACNCSDIEAINTAVPVNCREWPLFYALPTFSISIMDELKLLSTSNHVVVTQFVRNGITEDLFADLSSYSM